MRLWLYIKLGLNYRFLEISCSPEVHENLKSSTEGESNFDAKGTRGTVSSGGNQHTAQAQTSVSHSWKTWDVTPQLVFWMSLNTALLYIVWKRLCSGVLLRQGLVTAVATMSTLGLIQSAFAYV